MQVVDEVMFHRRRRRQQQQEMVQQPQDQGEGHLDPTAMVKEEEEEEVEGRPTSGPQEGQGHVQWAGHRKAKDHVFARRSR